MHLWKSWNYVFRSCRHVSGIGEEFSLVFKATALGWSCSELLGEKEGGQLLMALKEAMKIF